MLTFGWIWRRSAVKPLLASKSFGLINNYETNDNKTTYILKSDPNKFHKSPFDQFYYNFQKLIAFKIT